MDKHICHLLYIILNNAELTCDDHLPDRMWDICSFYAVQVLLSPGCQAGQLGGLSQVEGLVQY